MTPFEDKLLRIEEKKLLEMKTLNSTLTEIHETLKALNTNLRDTLGSAETGDALVAIARIPEEINALTDILDNEEE